MKNISNMLLLSLAFFVGINSYPQEEMVDNYLFLFGQINVQSNTTITYTLTSIGTYWELDGSELPISSNTNLLQAYVIKTGSTTSEPFIHYPDSTAWKGFIFPWISAPYGYTDNIAYGFYKVTNSYNSIYFYIDIRDCKYSGGCGYYGPDFFIRFDNGEDVFKWKIPGGDWVSISTGEILRVWEIRNGGTPPTTSEFESFWANALVMTNDGSNHPRIVWSKYPYPENLQGTISGYKIYRAYHIPGQTPTNFNVLTTVNENTIEYVDQENTIAQNNEAVSYYIKCMYADNPKNQYNLQAQQIQ